MELKKNKRIYAMKVVKKELVNDDEVCFTSVIMSKHDIKRKIKALKL